MPPKGTIRTLDTNIYADTSGITVRVGKVKPRRFGLGTPLVLLRQVRESMQKIHDQTKGTGAATLQRDAVRYLQRKAHLVNPSTVKAEVRAWCDLYGARPRHTLTRDNVLDARAAWLQQRLSAKTINNRVHRLRALFRELDGLQAWSPTDDIRPLNVQRTPIQRISPALVVAVLAKMAASSYAKRLTKTAARFMVYATTGRRPSEIARAQPADVDFDNRIWVPRDGKGGFTPGIYLNDDMIFAWRAFAAADAWGRFNSRVFPRTLRRYGWPAGVRPYNLRHTIGITLREAGFDVIDVGPGMFGHKSVKTTERHYAPVQGTALQQMSQFLDGRFCFPQNFPTNPQKERPPTPSSDPLPKAVARGKKGR
jgi:integrase